MERNHVNPLLSHWTAGTQGLMIACNQKHMGLGQMIPRVAAAGLLAMTCLAGCATPYQPMGALGGYEDMQVGQDMYRIAVLANGYTTPERAQKIALLRAADLTIQKGFTHFTVVGDPGSEVSRNRYGEFPSNSMVIKMQKGSDVTSTSYDAAIIAKELVGLKNEGKQAPAKAS